MVLPERPVSATEWEVTIVLEAVLEPKLGVVPYSTVDDALSFVVQVIVAPLFVIELTCISVITGAVVSAEADTFRLPTVPVIVPSTVCAVILTPLSTVLSVTALVTVLTPTSPETNDVHGVCHVGDAAVVLKKTVPV